jgi:hypothetical protein
MPKACELVTNQYMRCNAIQMKFIQLLYIVWAMTGSPFSLRVGSGSSGSADKHNHTRDSKYGASNTASFNKTKDTTTDISAESEYRNLHSSTEP